MPIPATIHEVFGRFQNLNLLALLNDLDNDRTARHGWSSGAWLCPVAHGLPAGKQVRELNALGQSANLEDGCEYAAQFIGADPGMVLRFVRCWDEETLSRTGLLRHLLEIWGERMEDAMAMQEMLEVSDEFECFPISPERERRGSDLPVASSSGC